MERYAQHEQATLTKVTQARSQATTINVSADVLNDPAAFNAINRRKINWAVRYRANGVSERYPDLKRTNNSKDLQTQQGTENRITVARGRYIQDVSNL